MGSREGHIDASGEFGFTKRFVDDYGIRLAPLDPSSVATDPASHKHMRERPRAQYFLYGGNVASPAQARIDDHQVRPVTGRGHNRLSLGGRCRANIVPMPTSNSESSMAIKASSSMTSTRSALMNLLMRTHKARAQVSRAGTASALGLDPRCPGVQRYIRISRSIGDEFRPVTGGTRDRLLRAATQRE